MKNNNTNTLEPEDKKTLCAIINPPASERTNQTWFYNIFLKHISRNPVPKHTKNIEEGLKINFIMKLTKDDIKKLRKRTCKIIEIESDTNKIIEIEKEIKKQLEKENE